MKCVPPSVPKKAGSGKNDSHRSNNIRAAVAAVQVVGPDGEGAIGLEETARRQGGHKHVEVDQKGAAPISLLHEYALDELKAAVVSQRRVVWSESVDDDAARVGGRLGVVVGRVDHHVQRARRAEALTEGG